MLQCNKPTVIGIKGQWFLQYVNVLMLLLETYFLTRDKIIFLINYFVQNVISYLKL